MAAPAAAAKGHPYGAAVRTYLSVHATPCCEGTDEHPCAAVVTIHADSGIELVWDDCDGCGMPVRLLAPAQGGGSVLVGRLYVDMEEGCIYVHRLCACEGHTVAQLEQLVKDTAAALRMSVCEADEDDSHDECDECA